MHKQYLVAGTAAAALCLLASGAEAQDRYRSTYGPSPYFQIEGGMTFLDTQGSGDIDFDSDWDSGYNLGAAIGMDYGNGFRSHLDFTYQSADVGDSGVDGDLKSISLLGELLYDFDMGDRWPVYPFVGAGIGVARISGDVDGLFDQIDDEQWAFAYRLTGGLGYRISEVTDITLAYRYYDTNEVDLDGTDVDLSTHNFTLALRVKF
ncbi:MAG: porin family protein [Alphaproteobacteria bacterium]|nr:porin family protein [Alphaproteobacteria bacterium]